MKNEQISKMAAEAIHNLRRNNFEGLFIRYEITNSGLEIQRLICALRAEAIRQLDNSDLEIVSVQDQNPIKRKTIILRIIPLTSAF